VFSPLGAVVGIILTKRLLSFRPELERLANSGPKAEDFLSKPKGFFGKRRYRKKLKQKKEQLQSRTENVYTYYFMGVTLVLICSIFGGYSVMIPVAMIIATALNKELFPASTPVLGRDQTKYAEIWNKYVQSNVHLLLGVDGEYDQKLMKKYNRRKSFFIYRWLTKETKAMKNLEESLGNDTDAVTDLAKGFFVSFLKLTLLLGPLDLILRVVLGEYSTIIPQMSWTSMDFYLNGAFCCFGIIGAIGGLNLMKIAISANPKLRLIPNKTSPPMMPPAPPSVPMMPPAPPSVPMMPPAPPSVPMMPPAPPSVPMMPPAPPSVPMMPPAPPSVPMMPPAPPSVPTDGGAER